MRNAWGLLGKKNTNILRKNKKNTCFFQRKFVSLYCNRKGSHP
nr:MAG TPA: hypothetical protein [Caudoviricetes sp.]